MVSESLLPLPLPLFSRNYCNSNVPYLCIWSSWQTWVTLSLLVQHLKTVTWTALKTARRLTFAVGPRELREFRMIERHYFRDQVNQLTPSLCKIFSLIAQNTCQNFLLINYSHFFWTLFLADQEFWLWFWVLYTRINQHLGCGIQSTSYERKIKCVCTVFIYAVSVNTQTPWSNLLHFWQTLHNFDYYI